MSPIRLNGSTSGYSQLDAPAVAGDQIFTLPGTGGTLDRLNRTGNILQVVQGSTSTATTVASTSYADATNLNASITPTSASSKVLAVFSANVYVERNSNVLVYGAARILRGSTGIAEFDWLAHRAGLASDSYQGFAAQQVFMYLDSPATTSSVTYKLQGKVNSTTNGGALYFNTNGATCLSTVLLMEVAA